MPVDRALAPRLPTPRHRAPARAHAGVGPLVGSFFVIVLAAAGCRDASPMPQGRASASTESAASVGAGGERGSGGPADLPHAARERAVTLTLTLGVDDVARAAREFRAAVRRSDGYLQAGVESGADVRSAHFEARIPAARVEAFRREVRRLGEVELDQEEVEDVGAQHADLQARLRSARVEEERLLTLVSQRTASVGDLVALEGRLGDVRERIERLEAEERVIQDRVALARVSADIHPRSIAYWKQPGATIVGAARWGVDAAAAVVVGAGATAVGVGPTLLVIAAAIALLVLVVRLLWRRRSGRRAAAA